MIHLNLEIHRGTFCTRIEFQTDSRVSGLFGPTGSGKTTLLMAMAGLIRPRRGRIEIGNDVVYDSERGVHLPPEKRRVGVVFQDSRLFPHLSVRSNLVFSGEPRDMSHFDEIIHLLDLEPLLTREIGELSGGQTRLVAIGRALLSKPRLLLLDEPLSGLDPQLHRKILAYLIRLKHSIDVDMLYVSHVFSDFMALVDETVLLHDGEVKARGTPEEIMTRALGEAEAGGVETLLPGIIETVSGEGIDARCGEALIHLSVPGARIGDSVYVTVRAEDVLLGTGPPPTTSARNVLSGRIAELRKVEGKVLVAVDVGPRIWAEITEDSRDRLTLGPGTEVYILIKSSALRGVVFPPELR